MHAISASLLVVSLTAAAPAQVRYTVTDLGTLGGFHAEATAISENGWVVGFANTPESGYDLAIVWRGPGINEPTAITGEGISGAFARAVNDDGLIVGISDSLSLHAFMFAGGVGGAAAAELAAIGGAVSDAYDVNGAGVVVGSAMESSGFNHAVKWLRNAGGTYTLVRLPELGGFGSAARAINSSGLIVGTVDLPNQLGVPCIWPETGGVQPLDQQVSSFGEALAVNDLGQVAGYAYTDTGTVAFVWSAATGAIDIGNLGNHHAIARGINNRGQVVGQAYIPGTSATQHGFVWQNGVLTDLHALIDPGSGWVIWDATAITDDGRIVGAGVKNGQPHAVMLVPIVCAADIGRVGGVAGNDGVLDNNDFVAFVDAFFAAAPVADRGSQGGVPGSDGAFDNNDF
ncbi:MAG TPA: GC-type dockerin domain-anchored protein, partial [Phycisphaerales bacterium]|nr:GC-type dockerin domain-anchored protein [Phycisphaerales bacterium]